MPPPPPLFPHIVGSRHGATEPPMRTAPSRRAEQCRTPRAERAACRRYAIMVSPTQSVPEVLAVWGSDYKIAIVCRRYTIMVAQPPSQISHITNPTTNPHHTHHHPRPYHNRVPPARCSLRSLHTAVKSTIPLAASTATEVQHGAAPQLLTPYDPPLGFIWFTITASFLRCGVGVFSSFSKVNIQFLRMFCVSVPVLLV